MQEQNQNLPQTQNKWPIWAFIIILLPFIFYFYLLTISDDYLLSTTAIITYILTMFGPTITQPLIAKLGLYDDPKRIDDNIDHEIIMHFISTITACYILFCWSLFVIIKYHRNPAVSNFIFVIIIIALVISLIAILHSHVWTQEFINRENYLADEIYFKNHFTWLKFLDIIKAPISIYRIILSVILILLISPLQNDLESTVTIKTNETMNGWIIPAGQIFLPLDSTKEFGFKPTTGYHLDSVFVDDNFINLNNKLTFIKHNTMHNIRAVFSKDTLFSIKIKEQYIGKKKPLVREIQLVGRKNYVFIFPSFKDNKIRSVIIDGENQQLLDEYLFNYLDRNHEISLIFSKP